MKKKINVISYKIEIGTDEIVKVVLQWFDKLKLICKKALKTDNFGIIFWDDKHVITLEYFQRIFVSYSSIMFNFQNGLISESYY